MADLAAGWGKLLAQEDFPDKSGLDVTLADMEKIAAVATQAIVRGAVGTMAEEQAQTPAPQQPCPTCGKICDVHRNSHTVALRGGAAEQHQPVARRSTCCRDSFPQRPVLRIDGHAYSPTILHRILHMAMVSSSFDQAEVSLKVVGELEISNRQVNNLAKEMGGQLASQRDEQTKRFVDQPLPRQATTPTNPIDLAAVFTDGGRMRTREPG